MARGWARIGVVTWALLGAMSASAASSSGTDFWLGLPAFDPGATTPQFVLNLTAAAASSGSVSVPGTAFSQTFSVTPGSTTTVPVPLSVEMTANDTVLTGHAVHITADQPVTVDALFQAAGESDGYLGLPTSSLGTSYDAVAVPGSVLPCAASEFELIGTQDGTTVTITPSSTIAGHTGGVPYPVSLDAGAAYLGMAAGTGDVSGTKIAADKPVAVISGNSCAQVPVGTAFANTVLEEDIPASAWGTEFFTLPFAGRTGGDVYRIINAQANTTVNRDGTFLFSSGIADQVNTMNLTGASHITADKPIMLVHLAQGGQNDMSGDPTMIVVPPAGSYTRVQTIATPATGFSNNRFNVSIATADVGTLALDGQPVPAGAFSPIGDSPTESGAQLSVTPGPHTLIAAGPFGVEAYGFAPDPAYDAYGFPGAFGDPARAPAPAATITIPANGATYAAGQVVNAAYSCSAAFGTTISACAGPVVNGAAIDTSPGTHSFAVSAADGYGAHASASVSYTVTPPSNQFVLKLGKPNKKTGVETVTVMVPGRGTLSGIETSKRGRTSVRVARARRTAQAAGRFTLTFRPSAKAKAILRRRHKLRVTISVSYTPTGGTARTKTARTTLRLTRR